VIANTIRLRVELPWLTVSVHVIPVVGRAVSDICNKLQLY
jgi:hypothetical protein